MGKNWRGDAWRMDLINMYYVHVGNTPKIKENKK